MKNRLLLLVILVGVIGIGSLGYLYMSTLKNMPREKAAERAVGEQETAKAVSPPIATGEQHHLYKEAQSKLKANKEKEALELLQRLVTDFPNSPSVDEALVGIGDIYKKQGNLQGAHDAYQKVVTGYPDSNSISLTQERLWDTNIKLLFSPLITPKSKSYEVKPGDTLVGIANSFNTNVALIMRSNNLKTSLIMPKKKLKVSTAKYSIIIDKSQNSLTLKSDEEVLKVYKVSTGSNNSTPSGSLKVVNKLIDPVWYKVGAVVPSQSPDNLLGSRWLGLSKKGYGIHGTRTPDNIGQAVSEALVWMTNPVVEELFTIIPIVTEVTIVD